MQATTRYATALVAAVSAIVATACAAPPSPIRSVGGVAQGTSYSLQWVGGAEETAIAAVAEHELARIDALLSNYRPDSVLEKFNATRSVEPMELPAELVALLGVARRVHDASAGCFDPTVRPLVSAWGFNGDAPAVPIDVELAEARANVGFEKLEIVDATHLRKSVPGLEIDMASIGQGYTAARLAELLVEHGSTAYLAEIGGEIVARGTKVDGSPWRIGIEKPTANAPGPALRLPPVQRSAVITSGSYRHFFSSDGRRLSHVLDPRTGWPVDHSLLAVTVVGGDATTAAAWATALMCLGPDAAVAAADRASVAALLWVEDGATAVLRQTRAFAADWSAVLDEPVVP
jgi:FAD:protein FMN transferase